MKNGLSPHMLAQATAERSGRERIGGWQLMYRLMESNAWLITETWPKLIECIPLLVRDDRRQEDIRKVDGDDPDDAARYGLVSGGRIASVGPAFVPPRAWQARPFHQPLNTPHFVTGMPLGEQITRQVNATDQTSRAIHYQRLEAEAKKAFRPAKLPRRRWGLGGVQLGASGS